MNLLVIAFIGELLLIGYLLYKDMEKERQLNMFKNIMQDFLYDIDKRITTLEDKKTKSRKIDGKEKENEKVRNSK